MLGPVPHARGSAHMLSDPRLPLARPCCRQPAMRRALCATLLLCVLMGALATEAMG